MDVFAQFVWTVPFAFVKCSDVSPLFTLLFVGVSVFVCPFCLVFLVLVTVPSVPGGVVPGFVWWGVVPWVSVGVRTW